MVSEAREQVLIDAYNSGLPDDHVPLADGGVDATAYADAVATYLAFGVDRNADRFSAVCTWDASPSGEKVRNVFSRQGVAMTWDFAEGNPFSESSGNWSKNLGWIIDVLKEVPAKASGLVRQVDAREISLTKGLISTDPPYYDNVGFADLSDFFYVWLRRSLREVFPDLFATLLTPKADELIASPYRHGGNKPAAEAFFEGGLATTFARIRSSAHPDYPLTVFYAFKQSARVDGSGEDGESATPNGSMVSTGWETFLAGLVSAGFSVHAT